MAPERPAVSFAALLRTSLLVCAASLVLGLVVWYLFRRWKLDLG